MIRSGYLVLADISGYTAFLTQIELEHSREILDHLLNGLVESFEPPLMISKLEGDAVFAHAPEGSFMQGQTLLEALEQVYFKFRLARDNLQRTCRCQSCTLASTLDLKLIVHYGQFSVGTIGTMEELQGPDVILAHRLLKNAVIEATRITTYAFFTEASAQAIPLGALADHMISHSESYEHLGEVCGYVHDLAAVWDRDRERRRVYIRPEDAWVIIEFDLPAPPALVWDYLNTPTCMCEWCGLAEVTRHDLNLGRLGSGSRRTCVHAQGKAVTVDRILDYQPFDYITLQSTDPGGVIQEMTTEVLPFENGSRVVWRLKPPKGKNPLHTLLVRGMMTVMKGKMTSGLRQIGQTIRAMIERDLAAGTVVVETPASTAALDASPAM